MVKEKIQQTEGCFVFLHMLQHLFGTHAIWEALDLLKPFQNPFNEHYQEVLLLVPVFAQEIHCDLGPSQKIREWQQQKTVESEDSMCYVHQKMKLSRKWKYPHVLIRILCNLTPNKGHCLLVAKHHSHPDTQLTNLGIHPV